MRQVTVAILASITLILCSHEGEGGVRMLRPDSGKRMWLPVAGKNRMYFRLDAGDTATVKVEGPGLLKLIVRGVVPSDADSASYSLDVLDRQRKLKSLRVSVVPTGVEWKESEEGSTKAHSVRLRLSRGEHRLRVVLGRDGTKAVGIRYSYEPGEELEAGVPFQPSETRETVKLLVKERPSEYYLTDATSPVALELVGPIRLRLISRLIFRPGARGRQMYQLLVDQDGVSLPPQAFSTTKSAVVECQSHPDWILGKSRTFAIDIPQGRHRIQIRAAGDRSPGVALRFSIPKKDLNNGL